MAEKIALVFISLIACAYIGSLVIGLILFFPFGLIGLLVLAVVGGLFVKVLLDRLNNKEDDYYVKNVDK
ncbi:MAG: hypothetical protein AAF639_42970 [Chloroflexota bacterium]